MHAPTRFTAVFVLTLAFAGIVGAQDPERVLFQSNWNDPPMFGYDYEEGVEQMSVRDCVGTWDCPSTSWTRYRMDVTSSNFDYLAKDLDNLARGSGKQSYAVAFRIRAEQGDGRDSGFVTAFSTEAGLDPGNGKFTGSFRNYVGVKFNEDGNSWSVQLIEAVNGAENTLASGKTGGSDEHRLFHLYVDNRVDSGPRVELQNYAGAPILTASSNPAHVGKAVSSQWFVGYGFGSNERTTILVADAPSTRIYDTHPQAPLVESVEFIPNPPDPGEALTVQATITDDWSVEAATVYYRVNGATTQQVPMQHDTGTRWQATIPGQSAGAHVVVRVEAYDDQDLVGHSEGEYSYTVGSGTPINRDDNSEIPNPPGGGGTTDPEAALTAADKWVAVLIAGIGGVFVYMAYRDGNQQRALHIAGGTILVAGAFLLYRGNPFGLRDTGAALLAALAIPSVLAAAWAWAQQQRRAGEERGGGRLR